MKKQLLLASLTALAVASTGFAAEGDGKGKGAKKPPMTPEQRAEGMIKNLDKDGDSKLDQAELAAMPARPPKPDAPAPAKPAPTPEERAAMMIKRGDKDADGKLDKTELAAVLQAPKKKPA
jgi:Ca2+-binding EF-hand superfamily protein